MDMARFEAIVDPGFDSVVGELQRWVRKLSLSSGELPMSFLIPSIQTSFFDECILNLRNVFFVEEVIKCCTECGYECWLRAIFKVELLANFIQQK